MKVTLESTTKRIKLQTEDGGTVEVRVWEGRTEAGVECHAFIVRIGARLDQDLSEFERELKAERAPSAEVASIPMKLIL